MSRHSRRVFQTIQMNIGPVLAFELLFRLLTLPLYIRLLDRLLKLSLKAAGYSYLTAGNIGFFLIRPWTLLCFLGISAIGMLFLVFEIAAVMTAFQGAVYGQRVSLTAMIIGGARKLASEIRKNNWPLFLLAGVDYLLVHSFLLYRILTHIRPLNFVMRGITEEPWLRALLVVLIAAAAVAAIASLFVFHGCMIGQKSFRGSFSSGLQLVKGCVFRISLTLFFYNICINGLLIASYLVCVLAAAVFVVLGGEQPGALAVLTAAGDRIEWILILIASVAVVIVNLGAVTVGYYERKKIPGTGTVARLMELYGKGVNYRVAAVTAGLVAAIGIFYIYDLVHNGAAMVADLWTEIPITAHRGSSMEAPENTLEALALAADQLADFAEIDVQLSSDGEMVLMHDYNLKRTAGVNRPVRSMTWDELRRTDVGSRFSDEYAGVGIPSLEQAVDFAKGRINLNIEIKNVGGSLELTDKVVALVEEYGMEEQCVITATRMSYLRRVKELNPELRTGYIVSAAYGDYYSDEAVDFISLRSSFVTQGLVNAAHELGKGVHVWTVNSKSELERMRLLGVDNVITDYPLLAREILYREEATESLLEYLRLVMR